MEKSWTRLLVKKCVNFFVIVTCNVPGAGGILELAFCHCWQPHPTVQCEALTSHSFGCWWRATFFRWPGKYFSIFFAVEPIHHLLPKSKLAKMPNIAKKSLMTFWFLNHPSSPTPYPARAKKLWFYSLLLTTMLPVSYVDKTRASLLGSTGTDWWSICWPDSSIHAWNF